MNFYKNSLAGEIKIPLSKSSLHRMLFLSLLNSVPTLIKVDKESLKSDDIQVSLNLLKKLNCILDYKDEILNINTKQMKYNKEIINCNECATTLRIIIPIMLFLYKEVRLTGSKKLLSRPLDFYERLFLKHDISFENDGNVISVKGEITKIFEEDIEIKDCNSSQFISGLMYILPLINKKCQIKFHQGMESVPYLKMTADVLSQINLNYDFIEEQNQLSRIKLANKEEQIQPCAKVLYPEIDYSSYAFWAVANDFDSKITVTNFDEKKFMFDKHPDKEIINILNKRSSIIDIKDTPDLLPILLVWTCFLDKDIKIVNFHRNRIKEANRVEGMIKQLTKLGAKISIGTNAINIAPIKHFKPAMVDSINDHRIAMALIIASLKMEDGIMNITGVEAINKSYPNFINDYESLKAINGIIP